jgi:hypothetical protein
VSSGSFAQDSAKMWFHLKSVALLIGVLAITLPRVYAADSKAGGSGPTTSGGRISISGGLSGTEVQSGYSLSFWATIENDSESSLNNLNVQLDAAEDEFRVFCLTPFGGNSVCACPALALRLRSALSAPQCLT